MRIPWSEDTRTAIEHIAEEANGMTGAEIVSICNHAGLEAFAKTKRCCLPHLTLSKSDLASSMSRMQSDANYGGQRMSGLEE